MPPALLPTPLFAAGGISSGQGELNAALMIQVTGWIAWALLVVSAEPAPGQRPGRAWLGAFLATKGLGVALVFLLAQATAIDRAALLNSLYYGAALTAYVLWGETLVRRWPEVPAARAWRAVVWCGLATWLVLAAWRGPSAVPATWGWCAVAPVIVSAAWLARHERSWAWLALGAALLVEFADARTVRSWYVGFAPELSLRWEELAVAFDGPVRLTPGGGQMVLPVSPAARLWFAGTTVAIWCSVFAWQAQAGLRRLRAWALPLCALAFSIAGFAIYSVGMIVALEATSRETFNRLETIATVAPRSAVPAPGAAAEWAAVRVASRTLGNVFRWRLDAAGRRVLLDPVEGYATGLPLLPLERDGVTRPGRYGFGPFMAPDGPSFFMAVSTPPDAAGQWQWLGVIVPLEHFYVYKRPLSLLGLTSIFLFIAVGIVGLGYTLHRNQELRQRLARERAEESARLKTTFLAKVSHELRTPLQSLLGYSQLIENAITEPTPRQHLQALRLHGDLMLRLVNDLLDLSAIESGAFRLVNRPAPLGKIIEQTVASLQPAAHAKHLALHCTIDPALPPWVATDGERLRQVALNLIGNALKFTETGRIDVSLRVTAAIADALDLELAVADTGPGIAPEHHARLFRAFSRLELATPKEGVGLGLALSAALCRSAGGDLTVESDGRSGSRFIARLRVARAEEPPASVRPTQLASLRGRRILVVDDNALVRDLFTAWLTELGATCESAADGASALARADGASFDAVVIDLAMPHLDGLEVTLRWRAQGRTWRIVGVSAHAGAKERGDALAAGMDAFLVKPVDLSELTAALAVENVPASSGNATAHAQLRARLATLFRADAATQRAAIAAALGRRDWPEFKAAAHYLKSSASVVGDTPLYDACTKVETAADACDESAARAAWQDCEQVLAPWLAVAPDPRRP